MDPSSGISYSSWVSLISQLGFPIVVCLWFMWRDYKFLTTLASVMTGIQIEITKLNELLDRVLSEHK
jgi:hypothetical protein